jgi:hypothetical protein
MDEILKESRAIRWIQEDLYPWVGRGPILELKNKAKEWVSIFLKDFEATPLATGGRVLLVAVGTNLFWLFLLRKALPPSGVLLRTLLFICALFFIMQRVDWKTLSSDSRFIQWLRRR